MKVFPTVLKEHGGESDGMDLRDYFAAQVMEGICAGDWKFDLKDGTVTWVEIAAKRAYEIADAMIEARE